MFTREDDADFCGTSLKAYIHASYPELENLFGEPLDGDGYKISGLWTFVNKEGEVFTLYDWKHTELYADGLPSVRQFRKSTDVVEFNVGAKGSALSFIQWLNMKIRESRKN